MNHPDLSVVLSDSRGIRKPFFGGFLMNSKNLTALTMLAMVALAIVTGAMALAQAPKDAKQADQPEFKLPPGWTAEDLKAVIEAGTPGKMHERLVNDAGQWAGKTTMWMAPGAEPLKSECTSTVTPVMDGRYVKVEMKGEMPGMGPYSGLGFYGYDNVGQEYKSMWIDNHNTAMMTGTGKLSADGKTLTWTYSCNCPLTKKPTTMRDVETITGSNTKTLESFGTDPKSGKEYKMMHIELTKK
jgi:hypothetical protein